MRWKKVKFSPKFRVDLRSCGIHCRNYKKYDDKKDILCGVNCQNYAIILLERYRFNKCPNFIRKHVLFKNSELFD